MHRVKRNHFIPAYYSRSWIVGPKFYVYDKLTNQYFRSTPASIGVISYLYPLKLERHFSFVEGPANGVLYRLFNNVELYYDKSIKNLLEWIVSLIVRNPYKANSDIVDYCNAISPDDVINADSYYINQDSKLVNNLINNYEYEIIKLTENKQFITSDFPVCELSKNIISGYEGLFIPLTPQLLLTSKLRNDKIPDTIQIINDTNDISGIINSILYESSTRHIISSSESILNNIVELTKLDFDTTLC